MQFYAWRIDRKRQQNSNCHGFAASTVYLSPAKFLAAWKACFLVILIEIARRRASSSKTNFLMIESSSDRTSKQSGCWMILIAPIKAALRGSFGKSPHGMAVNNIMQHHLFPRRPFGCQRPPNPCHLPALRIRFSAPAGVGQPSGQRLTGGPLCGFSGMIPQS